MTTAHDGDLVLGALGSMGTLVDCSGQTRAPFAAALREVYGETGDIDRYEFSGKTDPRIVFDLLTGAGRGATVTV